LDDYVASAMARWEVPGLAIAVVQEGKLVHARGYGVRSVGEDAKVDAETVFPIGSCTKPFAAAAIAKLIDSGKLKTRRGSSLMQPFQVQSRQVLTRPSLTD
jgi:CubicO group peptidase (beta-lactamase class C family)